MLFTLDLTIVSTLAAAAVCISVRATKRPPPLPAAVPEENDPGNYLDVPRGLITGMSWATVMWAAVFATLAR